MENKTERIYTRLTQTEKKKVEALARRCGLSISEYIRQRALGFVPRILQPDIFYEMIRRIEGIGRGCSGRREISDEICAARNKSVLEGKTIYGGSDKAYWARQKGQLTHREILKRDMEDALRTALNFEMFEKNMRKLGYQMNLNREYKHISVKASGWQRAVRLDRIGFTNGYLQERLSDNLGSNQVYWEYRAEMDKREVFPLWQLISSSPKMKGSFLSVRGSHYTGVLMESAVSVLLLMTALLLLMTGRGNPWLEKHWRIEPMFSKAKPKPLSPELRQELAKLSSYDAQVRLLAAEGIETDDGLRKFLSDSRNNLSSLEQERQNLRRLSKRKIEPEQKESLREEIKGLSHHIIPLRKKIFLAEEILRRSEERSRLLQREWEAESVILSKQRNNEVVR